MIVALGAPTSTARPASGGEFPFTKPITRDWVFWYAAVIMVLSLYAFAINETGLIGGFILDAIIGLPLNFAIFVLPVSLIRYFVRRKRR